MPRSHRIVVVTTFIFIFYAFSLRHFHRIVSRLTCQKLIILSSLNTYCWPTSPFSTATVWLHLTGAVVITGWLLSLFFHPSVYRGVNYSCAIKELAKPLPTSPLVCVFNGCSGRPPCPCTVSCVLRCMQSMSSQYRARHRFGHAGVWRWCDGGPRPSSIVVNNGTGWLTKPDGANRHQGSQRGCVSAWLPCVERTAQTICLIIIKSLNVLAGNLFCNQIRYYVLANRKELLYLDMFLHF